MPDSDPVSSDRVSDSSGFDTTSGPSLDEGRVGSWSLGIALLLVAAFFLYFARDIRAIGLGSSADPGPVFLPWFLAIVLAIGGVVELAGAVWISVSGANKQTAATATSDANRESNRPASGSPGGIAKTATLVAIIATYLVLIPWIGFQIATLGFTTLMLMMLGSRWWISMLVGVCLILIVRTLFEGFFEIQLPSGYWRLAW